MATALVADDCPECGYMLFGCITSCEWCGWEEHPSKAPAHHAVASKKHKTTHNREWAEAFVAKRVDQGAAYDARTHEIYCEACRHVYHSSATRGGKYAFALGIPDGIAWEENV